MEEESHVGDYDVICVCEEAVGWVISELSRSKSIEATDPSEDSTFFGEFVIDEG